MTLAGKWLGPGLFESLIVGQLAAAEAPIPVRVELDAPAGCPAADSFYLAVRQRTDRVRQATPNESATLLKVRLTRAGTSVFGELNLTTEQGESDRRVVRGVSCDEVVEALSLTAALALDPEALTSPSPPAPTPREPPPPPAPCPPAPAPPEKESMLGLGLGVRFLSATVVTPELSGGGGVTLRLEPEGRAPIFEIGVLHVDSALFGSPEQKRTQLTALTLAACPLEFELDPRFAIAPCALGVGGFLDAAGRGVAAPETVVRSYLSAGAELVLEAKLGSLAVDALGAVSVPLLKRRFVSGLEDLPAGETPAVSTLFGVGLRYDW